MDFAIRQIKDSEISLLKDFLYHAIFQRDGSPLAPKSIIEKPELQIYIKDFGKHQDDFCLCVQVGEEVVGMAWVRNIEGYGNIDDNTPELAISILPNYRNKGIGSKLLDALLKNLKEKGYQKTSLVVQKDNYALSMYKKAGYEIVGETQEEFIMVYKFV